MKLRVAILSTALLAASSAAVMAAPAAYQPPCTVTGTVVRVSERYEPYSDKGWAKSWNLPDGQTYTDVVIDVVKTDDACDDAGETTYQLEGGVDDPETGACVTAVTQFSGDEFRIGDWIKSYETNDQATCERM